MVVVVDVVVLCCAWIFCACSCLAVRCVVLVLLIIACSGQTRLAFGCSSLDTVMMYC